MAMNAWKILHVEFLFLIEIKEFMGVPDKPEGS